jgi:predicted DsbA family dithiol-disulfide isomerase
MKTHLKIDFVSDVVCPWCIIGLNGLQQALDSLRDEIEADLHFQPFQLNPAMPPEGQALDEHLSEKYRFTPEQLQQNREAIRARGEQVGFHFNLDKRSRTYNTFDAHRLSCWAEEKGRQLELERALFEAYFTEGENPSDHDVLVRLAEKAGLDPEQARQVLAADAYAEEVREKQRFYHEQGIHSVPSIIINDRYLIRGGQPAEDFAQALRRIAAENPQ